MPELPGKEGLAYREDRNSRVLRLGGRGSAPEMPLLPKTVRTTYQSNRKEIRKSLPLHFLFSSFPRDTNPSAPLSSTIPTTLRLSVSSRK